MNHVLAAVFLVISVSGCATPFRAPSDVAHIKLERRDSPVVLVEKIWLERKKGTLVVKGYVLGRLGAADTTQTHLDVTLYDESNRVLRSTVERFDPRQIPGVSSYPQIPGRRHRIAYACYKVTLDPLPSGTARIEVSAHEGWHGTDGPRT